LESVQEAAPAPRTTTDDIIAQAGRIRARRAVLAVAGGVVACLALTTVVATGLGATNTDGQPAAAPAAPSAAPAPSASAPPPVLKGRPLQPNGFQTRLQAYRVGEYQIGPAGQVAPGYERIPVYRDGETWQDDTGTKYPLTAGMITVYNPGVYEQGAFNVLGNDTMLIGAPYEVPVAGRTGIGRDWTYVSPADRERQYVRAALAWQYADNAWATFQPDYATADLPRADLAKIAAKLSVGRESELKVPYRLGFVPEGWRPVAVTQTPSAVSSLVSKVFLHKGPLTESAATTIDEVFPHSAMITVSRTDPKDATISGKDGLHCYDKRTTCVIVQGEFLVEVTDWNAGLSSAEVKKIAQGLELRDLADQKTWLPLTD
jgi:hypothetical protein